MKRLGMVILSLVLLGAACQSKKISNTKTVTVHADRGVSFSPKSLSGADISQFFTLAPQAGKFLSWAGSWRDLNASSGAPSLVMAKAKQLGLTPIIIVGFTKDDLGHHWDDVQKAVVDFAREQHPAYLGVGNEINKSFDAATVETYSRKFSAVRDAVRGASPQTKMFPTWQLEWMQGLHGGLFGGKNSAAQAQWDELGLFPAADLTVFTSYPGLIYGQPTDIPNDYYSGLAEHVHGPMAFSEIGWFRSGPAGFESSAGEQAECIQVFFSRTRLIHPAFTIWPFVYDPDTATVFKTMGLLEDNQTTSPAWEMWKEYNST